MPRTPTNLYKNPEIYSQNNNLQYDFAMRVIEDIGIDKNSRVIDIGCGDGKITSKIAEIASEGCVIGTDVTYEMIAYASTAYESQENLGFVRMNAGINKFINQFDLLMSFNCLHWVKDQERALRGIARAAAQDARIVLLLSHKKSIYDHAFDSVCANEKWQSYFKDYINPRSFFELDAYKNMLIKAGLNVVSMKEEELTYHYNSRENLKAFFDSSIANVTQVPQEKKEEFIDDYCNEFLKQSGANDMQQIPLSFWCLVVKAAKMDIKVHINNRDEICHS